MLVTIVVICYVTAGLCWLRFVVCGSFRVRCDCLLGLCLLIVFDC